MNFLTKENQIPSQGKKEKIYISGHSKDLPFFHGISKEILEIQNSIIYMNADLIQGVYSVTAEEWEASLSQMHLMVFVVSGSFLFEDCPARTYELEYARKNNIPILPIIVENGLEEVFDRLCGTLHLLNRNAADYFNKLKEYMDLRFNRYHLLGTPPVPLEQCKLSKVFISYRKKDRCEAEKAIRLIRSYDFLRDVEIWYDDFLVEGEEYNEEINRNLMSSEIFLLIVTPNLLSPDNYVMRIEYPNARRSGKYILPLMMENTDPAELAEKYEGIGEVIDSSDGEAVVNAFAKALRGVERLRDRSPFSLPKLFMLGLAYLEGNGMELNPKIGIAMLQEAADRGYHYALERLGKLYGEGIGVQKDVKKAIRYLLLADDAFEADPNAYKEGEESIYHNARANRLHLLFELCIAHKEMALAKQVAVRRERSVAILRERKEYYSLKNIYATNLMEHALIYQIEGDYYTALGYYQKAMKEIMGYEETVKDPNTVMNALMFYRNYGNCLHLISVTDRDPIYRQQAVACLLHAIKRSRFFNKNYGQVAEDTEAIAYELAQLAMEYRNMGDNFNAIEIYTVIHDEYEEFAKEFPEIPHIREMLAATKLEIAFTANPQLGYQPQLYREAYSILVPLCEQYPENAAYRKLLRLAAEGMEQWKN